MMKLLLFFSFLFSSGAFANAVMFGSPSYVSVTGTATQVLAQNSLRSYLLIQNVGTSTIYASFGNSSSYGVPIFPGSNYEPDKAPSNSVFLQCPTGSNAVVVQGQ